MAVGPSPHAWGLLVAVGLYGALCLGHPHMRGDYSWRESGACASTGHPHMRGDYAHVPLDRFAERGPSPHAWGLHGRVARQVSNPRAIPTCVGTTHDPDGKNPR